jgi:hypothetical protein
LTIRFVGLIDPVATGVVNAPSEIKSNTNVVCISVRDGNYLPGDLTIFKKWEIKLENKGKTKIILREYKKAHKEIGFDKQLMQDLINEAVRAGVKFK